jgi:hypothetical protein
MKERTWHDPQADSEVALGRIGGDEVRQLNHLQVEQSARQIYCTNDAFDLAHELVERDPNLRAPRRSRVTVDVLPTENPLKDLIALHVWAKPRDRQRS